MEQISNSFARLILQGVQRQSGAQYPMLLREARLTRFLEQLPPDDPAPGASAAELSALFGGFYKLLGEQMTRLFLRNTGTAFGQFYVAHPTGKHLIGMANARPIEERLGLLIRAFVQQSNQTGAPRMYEKTTENGGVVHLVTTLDCYMCGAIQGASAPLCALTEHMVRTVAAEVGLHHLRIAEIECRATGAPHCKLAFYESPAGSPPA